MANNKNRKVYDTSEDTMKGKLFRALIRSSNAPVAPQGERPVLPDVTGIVDPTALEQDWNKYGAGGNVYLDLAKKSPDLAKQYGQTMYDIADYDRAMDRYNKVLNAQNAVDSGSATFGDMATVARDYWNQQGFIPKAAGIGLGLGNIGGLMDNDKFGGQLGGLALGGLGAKALMSSGAIENPGAAALLTLGGGELGALFDKLRSKREGQRQQMAQQQQYRR